MEPLDDGPLWARARAGDGRALGELVDRHRDAVFRQGLRLLDAPADAEEVAASAFFELWRRRDAVRLVAGSVRPWLLVTVTNVARNRQRAAIRYRAALQRIPHEAYEPALIERIDGAMLRHDLVIALRAVRPADAALLTMTALEGYSIEEVAGLLGIGAGAARVRLHRVRGRLRVLLEGGTTAEREAAR